MRHCRVPIFALPYILRYMVVWAAYLTLRRMAEIGVDRSRMCAALGICALGCPFFALVVFGE